VWVFGSFVLLGSRNVLDLFERDHGVARSFVPAVDGRSDLECLDERCRRLAILHVGAIYLKDVNLRALLPAQDIRWIAA
jgi:hypothetical protein